MLKSILSIALFSTLVLATGPVLKTGQTKSYDVNGNEVTDGSVKDDGYYQMGKARSYSRSDAGVVTDHATGLQWQDDVESVEKPWLTQENYDKCTGNNDQEKDESKCTDTSGDTAATYCSTLALDGGGWRLPTIEELETLVDYGHYNPSVKSGVFQHITLNGYWSSTTSVGVINYVWLVWFAEGNLDNDVKAGNRFVRCVRNAK